ncbi:CsbD family protein [Paraburkholderia tagetis]|uniref:CsbD family protein n=1 Tax=Paraburkholderia tagetis TaxID=2913261 RepID=A0A9X1RNE2_9BURK|nr:CsbD family protein [Paraburkholderia tagetis]MCG5074623.1 CsbD family protein [Paraburkholderia tagetis]
MNNDIAAGKWKQLLGKAKATWGKLADDELMRVEGHAERLVGLIQERYGKTRDEAEREVHRWLETHGPRH